VSGQPPPPAAAISALQDEEAGGVSYSCTTDWIPRAGTQHWGSSHYAAARCVQDEEQTRRDRQFTPELPPNSRGTQPVLKGLLVRCVCGARRVQGEEGEAAAAAEVGADDALLRFLFQEGHPQSVAGRRCNMRNVSL
jgi:hypothetical protein